MKPYDEQRACLAVSTRGAVIPPRNPPEFVGHSPRTPPQRCRQRARGARANSRPRARPQSGGWRRAFPPVPRGATHDRGLEGPQGPRPHRQHRLAPEARYVGAPAGGRPGPPFPVQVPPPFPEPPQCVLFPSSQAPLTRRGRDAGQSRLAVCGRAVGAPRRGRGPGKFSSSAGPRAALSGGGGDESGRADGRAARRPSVHPSVENGPPGGDMCRRPGQLTTVAVK